MSLTDEARNGVDRAEQTTEELADSKPMSWAGRIGIGSRATIYLLLGVLALLLALGESATNHVDQRGALAVLASHPLGAVVVALLAAGFIAYAVWQLSEAVRGPVGQNRTTMPRIEAGLVAVGYGLLAYVAISLLAGPTQPQSHMQQGITARIMNAPGGQVLIALVGAGIAAVAVVMAIRAARCEFLRPFGPLPPGREALVKNVGRIGGAGRALVFVAVGGMVVYAAWTHRPNQADGLDSTLKTLLQQPYGRPIVALAALALLVFGIYGLLEARYRRVIPSEQRPDERRLREAA